jgi:arylsulfatase A-like enzyme
MSDEHNPEIAGYAGHPIISTPALDTLAARGSRFTAAYTPSPICVPARASLATGLPVHRHRAWDNAIAYDGRIQSWAHALRNRGHHVASIGKLHYRGHPEDDYGLTESLLAMHITGGVGDLTHLVRDPDDIRTTGKNLIASAGPGNASDQSPPVQMRAGAVCSRSTGLALAERKASLKSDSIRSSHSARRAVSCRRRGRLAPSRQLFVPNLGRLGLEPGDMGPLEGT